MLHNINKIVCTILILSSLTFGCSGENNSPSNNKIASGLITVSDIGLGPNRIAFKLLTPDGNLINDAYTKVSFTHLQDKENPNNVIQHETSMYSIISNSGHNHPDGAIHSHLEKSTLYVASKIYFSKPGFWKVSLWIKSKKYPEIVEGNMFITVNEATITPEIGSRPPFTNNPTIATNPDLTQISTLKTINKNLYQFTVEEALKLSRPTIIAFSSPNFCQSTACSSVTESINEASKLNNKIIFIHVEPWNLNTAREIGKLEWTKQALAWKIPTEPWVFLINDNGNIVHKIEGPVSLEELIFIIGTL
jgi:hypothetical protein